MLALILFIVCWLFSGLVTAVIANFIYEKRTTTQRFIIVFLLGFISAAMFIDDIREQYINKKDEK